ENRSGARASFALGKSAEGKRDLWREAVAHWRTLPTDPGAKFDRELTIDATQLAPRVTWGTSPGMVADINGTVPSPDSVTEEADKKSYARALEYMDLKPGMKIQDIKIDT